MSYPTDIIHLILSPLAEETLRGEGTLRSRSVVLISGILLLFMWPALSVKRFEVDDTHL